MEETLEKHSVKEMFIGNVMTSHYCLNCENPKYCSGNCMRIRDEELVIHTITVCRQKKLHF